MHILPPLPPWPKTMLIQSQMAHTWHSCAYPHQLSPQIRCLALCSSVCGTALRCWLKETYHVGLSPEVYSLAAPCMSLAVVCTRLCPTPCTAGVPQARGRSRCKQGCQQQNPKQTRKRSHRVHANIALAGLSRRGCGRCWSTWAEHVQFSAAVGYMAQMH